MKKAQFYNSKAWRYFSKYIKLYYSNDLGVVRNYTGSGYHEWDDRNLHLGHWIKVFDGNRSNFNVAFNEFNCLPQSYQDNRFFGGKPEIMEKELRRIHGDKKIDEVVLKSKLPFKLDKVILGEIAKLYEDKLITLCIQKGINFKTLKI